MAQRTPPRVLVLSSQFPYPVIGGERTRIYYTAKLLSSRFRVNLLTLSPTGAAANLPEVRSVFEHIFSFPITRSTLLLNALGKMVAGRSAVLRYEFEGVHRWLRANAASYDMMYCNYITMAPYGRSFSGPKVIDFVDAISLHYKEAERWVHGFRKGLYALDYPRLLHYERQALADFDLGLVSSPVDHGHLLQHAGPQGAHHPLVILPTGVKEETLQKPDGGEEQPWIVFLGKMSYFPNEDAVLFFAKDVLPLVREHHPHAEFIIVGADPSPKVRRLARLAGVRVTGFVQDPACYLDRAMLVVAPMRVASGIQTKVLEAMGRGKAVVTTSLAVRGIQHGQDGVHFATADTAEAMANRVAWLLEDDACRRAMGQAGRALVLEHYTWQAIGTRLLAEVEGLLHR